MAIAVILANIITSVTGMAGGLLMFAAMNMFIPLKPLIAVHGAVQVFNNAARSWFLKHHVDWQKCIPFALGALLGAGLTTTLIARYVTEFWPLLVLIGLVSYTLFKPKSLPSIKISDTQFFWVGLATGSLGIVVGVIDPILAVFFLRDDMTKEQVIANKSLMQTLAHLTKIPAFLYLGFSFFEHFELILVLSLAGVIGAKFGVWLLSRINTQIFFTLMKLGLLIALIKMCMQLFESF